VPQGVEIIHVTMSTVYIYIHIVFFKKTNVFTCVYKIYVYTRMYIYIHMELHMELHMCSYVYTTLYVSNLSNVKGIRTEQSGIPCDSSSKGVIP
jgi:hypothetical protein